MPLPPLPAIGKMLRMPCQVRFEAPARFVIRSWGDVSATDVQDAFSAILTDPRLVSGTTILGIATDVGSVPDAIDLQTLAAVVVELRDKGVVAFANVSSLGTVYGAAEIFSAFATRNSIRIRNFTDETEARRYLDAARASASPR